MQRMAIGDDQGAVSRRREPPADARRALARNVAVVIALKLCALVAIWQLWFADAPPHDASGAATAARLLGTPVSTPAHARRDPDARR